MRIYLVICALLASPLGALGAVELEPLKISCRATLNPNNLPAEIFPPQATHLKPEQAADSLLHLASLTRGHRRELTLSQAPVYAFTPDLENRQTEWEPIAKEELESLTGWTLPFGVSYNPTTQRTQFVAIGDPSMIKAIRLRVFESASSEQPTATFDLEHHSDLNDGLAWVAEVEGPQDGLWYDFEYESVPGSKSFSGEPVPATFAAVDPVALWSTATRSRVYFPPRAAGRAPRPDEVGLLQASPLAGLNLRPPTVTLELGLKDLIANDVSEVHQGSATALIESAFFQGLIAPYSMIEFLPVRHHDPTDVYGYTVQTAQGNTEVQELYFHIWGYMPEQLGIDLSIGGPDALIALIEHRHQAGQAVMKDEVIQHTANKPRTYYPSLNVFHFALPDVYRCWSDDLTGCGNVTNLDMGSTFAKLNTQMIINDVVHVGWDGYRFDLMGAIPRDTTQMYVDLLYRLGARVTGEPYGANYVMSLWNTENNVVRGASVWDHKYKREVPEAIKAQAPISQLLAWMGGGSFETWVDNAQDRTAVLETHDGETQAHKFGGNLHMVRYGVGLLLASMGDVALTLSQVFGIQHSKLDNTPLDLSNLSEEQISHMQQVNEMVALRAKLSAFFAWPHLDQDNDIDFVTTSDQSHNFGYLWIKQPAYATIEVPEGQQVVILINNSQYDHEIELPPGQWFFQQASNDPFASQSKTVSGSIATSAFSTVVLTRLPVDD
jgi:hypothetical protein